MADPADAPTMSSAAGALPWHELRILGLIAGFGAVGGVVSWIYTITIGDPLPLDGLAAPAASLLAGAFAGVVGVILLANVDTTKAFTKTVAIAMVFGFFWKPTIEAGQALIEKKKQERAEKQARALATEAERAVAKLAVTPKGELDENTSAAISKMYEALTAAQRVEKRAMFAKLAYQLTDTATAKLPPDKEVTDRFRKALEQNPQWLALEPKGKFEVKDDWEPKPVVLPEAPKSR